MSVNQQGPKPPKDNLIVHIAKCLREDIYAPHGVELTLRQWPFNDDDHDSWDIDDGVDKWYYIAYSIIDDLDPARAKEALTDLVATDKEPK
jgi:hypothetical protein